MDERYPPKTKNSISEILEGDASDAFSTMTDLDNGISLTYGDIRRIHDALGDPTNNIGDLEVKGHEELRIHASEDIGSEAVHDTVHLNWG